MQKKLPALEFDGDSRPSSDLNATRGRASVLVAMFLRAILSSYPIELVAIYLILILWPVWMFSDASFSSALFWARRDSGLPFAATGELPFEAEISRRVHQWDTLGPRIGLIIAAGSLVPVLFGVVFARFVLARPMKLHIVAALLAMAGIVTVCLLSDELIWAGTQYRVHRSLWRMEAATIPLLREWPNKPGVLPELGKYGADKTCPGMLFLEDPARYSYSLDDRVGPLVRQLPDGGVEFRLAPSLIFSVEFHPGVLEPAPQISRTYGNMILLRSAKLRDGWFLTKYGAATKDTVGKRNGSDDK